MRRSPTSRRQRCIPRAPEAPPAARLSARWWVDPLPTAALLECLDRGLVTQSARSLADRAGAPVSTGGFGHRQSGSAVETVALPAPGIGPSAALARAALAVSRRHSAARQYANLDGGDGRVGGVNLPLQLENRVAQPRRPGCGFGEDHQCAVAL